MNPDSSVEPDAQAQPTVAKSLAKIIRDESGATTLEYGMLLAAIGIPSYFIIQTTLSYLLDYYQMVTALNALPFP